MNESHTVFEETRRNVAGIDIAGTADHYVCGPRKEDGTYDTTHFGTTTSELYRLLAWLREQKVESVALESTSVYWIPVADLLEANGIEVVLVDTREVRMVPGRKSDVKDCQWLQRLHSCGLLHAAFRPPEAIVAVRTLLREKENLVATRAQFIQQMQKSCDQMNIRIHHAVSDIDGATGMAIVNAIIGGERDAAKLAKFRDKRCKKTEAQIAEQLRGTWREEHLFNLAQAHGMLISVDETIARYEEKIASMYRRIAESFPREPRLRPPPEGEKPTARAKRLRDAEGKQDIARIIGSDITMIDGIAYGTTSVVVSELGWDFTRFPNEHHFASYIGLAPSLGKSAGKNVRQKRRHRNTHRVGRVLRMAAATLHRSDTELGAFFRSVARRSDWKTAVKATARKMAHMIYRAVRYGVEYVDKGAKAYEERAREKTIKTVKHLIKSLGISELELSSALNPV
jgi:transposase